MLVNRKDWDEVNKLLRVFKEVEIRSTLAEMEKE